jgi:hypothetical protein
MCASQQTGENQAPGAINTKSIMKKPKNNTVLSVAYTSRMTAFKAALDGAKNDLKTAGEILVELVKENENTFEIIVRECPGITEPFLQALYRIGRGQLDPLLLQDPSPAAQRAVRLNLPIAEQRKLTTAKIEVARPGKNGGGDTVVKKSLDELTQKEVSRVIGEKGIRTVKEQVAIIKNEQAAKKVTAARYEIFNNRIIFHEGATFDYFQLMDLASKIAPKAQDIEASVKQKQIA